MRILPLFICSALILVFAACQSDDTNGSETAGAQSKNVYHESPQGFRVVKGPESSNLKGSGITNMDYSNGEIRVSINGFDLGVTTEGTESRPQNPLNQHIQPFITSIPGTPKNTSNFGIRLPNYTMILGALLVQSDNYSVKESGAGFIHRFTLADGNVSSREPITSPSILLNHPNGVYSGDAATSIPLDFFIFNFEPGENRKIEVKLNGETFLLDTWQNYAIEGLNPGTHKVGVKLVDGSGNVAEPGGLLFVERDFRVQ